MTAEAVANHDSEYICPTCQEAGGAAMSVQAIECDGSGKNSTQRRSVAAEMEPNAIINTPSLDGSSLISVHARRIISDLLSEMQAHKLAWPFLKPPETDRVSNEVVDLKHPFDLIALKKEFEAGRYETFGDLSLAMSNMFSNQRLLHPPASSEFNCTDVMEGIFVRRMKEIKALL